MRYRGRNFCVQKSLAEKILDLWGFLLKILHSFLLMEIALQNKVHLSQEEYIVICLRLITDFNEIKFPLIKYHLYEAAESVDQGFKNLRNLIENYLLQLNEYFIHLGRKEFRNGLLSYIDFLNDEFLMEGRPEVKF